MPKARALPAVATENNRRDVLPIKCTGATVRRFARRITSFYDLHLQPTGLKLSQYSVLAHLSDEPRSLLQLSRRLEMDRTTLTRNLAPLLDNGWVAQVRGDDARQRLLVLTPAGQRQRAQARDAWKAAQQKLEEHLGSDLIAGLHTRLDSALRKLKAVLPEEN